MSHKETSEFKYPCVHSTPKSGIRFMYSKINNKGHFGIKKVIFGESGIDNAIFDKNGEYGITNGGFALEFKDNIDGYNLLKLKDNTYFKNILKNSLTWSSFRIDWNIFKEFKKDFWKEFIGHEDDEPILEKTNTSTKDEIIVDDKKYTCDCGSVLNKNGKTKHEETLKHKKFIDSK